MTSSSSTKLNSQTTTVAWGSHENAFHSLARRLDAGTLSERRIILIVSMFLILSLWYLLLFAPLTQAKKQLTVQLDTQAKQLQLFQGKYRGLLAGEEGLKQLQQQKTLQTELTALDTQIAKITGSVVPANQMAELLKTVLKNEGLLKFVSLKNLPAQNLASPKGEVSDQDYMLLQQGIEFVFQGNYTDTLKYLQALENTKKWRVLWDSLDYEVMAYPEAQVTLRVHTLVQYINEDTPKNEETQAVSSPDSRGGVV